MRQRSGPQFPQATGILQYFKAKRIRLRIIIVHLKFKKMDFKLKFEKCAKIFWIIFHVFFFFNSPDGGGNRVKFWQSSSLFFLQQFFTIWIPLSFYSALNPVVPDVTNISKTSVSCFEKKFCFLSPLWFFL